MSRATMWLRTLPLSTQIEAPHPATGTAFQKWTDRRPLHGRWLRAVGLEGLSARYMIARVGIKAVS
jgi:hypothetical protein